MLFRSTGLGSWPVHYHLCFSLVCCVFLFFSLFFPYYTSISFRDDDTLPSGGPVLFRLPPFILSAVTRFTIFTLQLFLAPYGCPSKTTHWLAGCPATIIALNMLVAPLLIPRQNGLSCFLPPFFLTTFIWIRSKPLPHLPLWHASSGLNSFLFLLGEMSF